jgi:hypothetical protein
MTRMRKYSFVTLMAGGLTMYALLEIGPALAATDEAAEQDHLVIVELGAAGGSLDRVLPNRMGRRAEDGPLPRRLNQHRHVRRIAR